VFDDKSFRDIDLPRVGSLNIVDGIGPKEIPYPLVVAGAEVARDWCIKK
jgi:hypothetical protein